MVVIIMYQKQIIQINITNHTNGTTNTSYWQLNLEGFNYRAAL